MGAYTELLAKRLESMRDAQRERALHASYIRKKHFDRSVLGGNWSQDN